MTTRLFKSTELPQSFSDDTWEQLHKIVESQQTGQLKSASQIVPAGKQDDGKKEQPEEPEVS